VSLADDFAPRDGARDRYGCFGIGWLMGGGVHRSAHPFVNICFYDWMVAKHIVWIFKWVHHHHKFGKTT
jgi:hypothetical protein